VSILKRLTPINLLEEKQKFFSDFSYNPQFVYDAVVPDEELYQYGKPDPAFVSLAQSILDKEYKNRNETDLRMNQGSIFSEPEVTRIATDFLEMHALEDRIKIHWSSSFVSRASITPDSLRLRKGSEFRKENLLGMLYHEIGTHAIRRVNYEQQPWFKHKKKYGFSSYLETEEGLASLHSLLPFSYKSAYSTAIRYAASHFSQSHSFSELWSFLEKYIDDLETRWMITFRQKRGVADTSSGSGFTKDLVYFQGMVKVYNWLAKNDFDLYYLYFGKLALEDIELAKKLNPAFEPLLPSFFTLNKQNYVKQIKAIGKANSFDEFSTLH